MKKVIFTNQRKAAPVFHKLLERFQDFGLNAHSDYTKYRQKADEFIKQCNGTEIPDLLTQRLDLVVEDLKFDTTLPEDARFDFILGVENFFIVIKQMLKGIDAEKMEFQGFSREPSPAMEAYDYIGHNKLDVKYDNTKHSFLYE